VTERSQGARRKERKLHESERKVGKFSGMGCERKNGGLMGKKDGRVRKKNLLRRLNALTRNCGDAGKNGGPSLLRGSATGLSDHPQNSRRKRVVGTS